MAQEASRPWRTQPPAIEDPRPGYANLPYLGDEEDGGGSRIVVPDPPHGLDEDDVADTHYAGERRSQIEFNEDEGEEDEDGEETGPSPQNFEERGKAAFRTSTSYMDSNYRKNLDDSLKAFNSQHPGDSKYNSETFKKRSNLFRPITRAVISKNEAALCAALFSNLDLIECAAANPGEKEEIVSAEVMQALLQERLTITIPWFQLSIGGFQDAQVQGIVIGHSYWKRTATGKRHKYKVLKDEPCQELIPLENFRFDPSASWTDPVNTSPYVIHLMPMYIGDVKERMRLPDPKGRKWNRLSDEILKACRDSTDDSTRSARTGLSQDATQQARDVDDYDVVWIHRHIHRWEGEDYEFYMLASKYLLTDPEPLRQNVWFGRAAVCGWHLRAGDPQADPQLRADHDEGPAERS